MYVLDNTSELENVSGGFYHWENARFSVTEETNSRGDTWSVAILKREDGTLDGSAVVYGKDKNGAGLGISMGYRPDAINDWVKRIRA